MMKPFALAVSLTALAMSLCAARTPRVNYDETKVFPYEIADPLTFADGTKVKSADDWRKRRMEILDIFAKKLRRFKLNCIGLVCISMEIFKSFISTLRLNKPLCF